MKIWIALAETDSGNEMSYFYSQADAERYAIEFCKARWNEASDPMPNDWRAAYETLTADPYYTDWLHMDDLDISGHPDVLAVKAGLANITTRAAYLACFAGGADFPTEPQALAELAAKMIKTGFVIHREFESCFEMGNGGEVMKLLVHMALKDEALRDWWQRGAYYIGDFEKVRQRFYPNG